MIQAGTVLTCERTKTNYRWLVDGVEKASVRADSITTSNPANYMRDHISSKIKPFISAIVPWASGA